MKRGLLLEVLALYGHYGECIDDDVKCVRVS